MYKRQNEYDEAIMQEIERQAENSGVGKSKSKAGSRDELPDDDSGDELIPRAIEVVVEAGEASVSLLQRRLRLGYARAGRLVDELEERGIVGPREGSKSRRVLITRQQWLEMNMNRPDGEEEEDVYKRQAFSCRAWSTPIPMWR